MLKYNRKLVILLKGSFILVKRYWWILIAYAITQFAPLAYGPMLLKFTSFDKFEATIYGTILSFFLGFIVILIMMKPDMEAGLKEGIDYKKTILWVIIGFFLANFAQTAALLIELFVFNIMPNSENTSAIMEVTRQLPLFMVLTAVIAPVLEEIVFRKIIFGTVYKRTNFFIAALISSVIFGIVHGEPIHLLVYAGMGFVLAFIYVKTKTLLAPIAVHVLLNTVTVIRQYNLTPEEIQEQLDQINKLIGG